MATQGASAAPWGGAPRLAGRLQDGDDLKSVLDALGRLAGLQHLWRVEPLARPAAHLDRPSAAVSGGAALGDCAGVSGLDLHGRLAGNLAAVDLDFDRYVRGGLGGTTVLNG